MQQSNTASSPLAQGLHLCVVVLPGALEPAVGVAAGRRLLVSHRPLQAVLLTTVHGNRRLTPLFSLAAVSRSLAARLQHHMHWRTIVAAGLNLVLWPDALSGRYQYNGWALPDGGDALSLSNKHCRRTEHAWGSSSQQCGQAMPSVRVMPHETVSLWQSMPRASRLWPSHGQQCS